MGRRKTTAELKAKGTFEPCKHGQRIDDNLPMLPQGTTVAPPPSLKDENIKALWTITTNKIIAWHALSEADLTLLEKGFVVLEEINRIEKIMKETSPTDDNYDKINKRYLRNLKVFQSSMYKFGLSPIERSKLALTDSIIKKNNPTLDKIKPKNES